MAKVYLESSFISACVTTRATTQAIAWREASKRWMEFERLFHTVFTSTEAILELGNAANVDREAAFVLLSDIHVVGISTEAMDLASRLVSEQVMPGPAVSGDAVHVPVATLERADFVLSWNVKHLANPNKRKHLAVVCKRLGLIAPELVTPDLLKESDHE